MYDTELRKLSAVAARAALAAQRHPFDPTAQLEARDTRRAYRVALAARRLSETLVDVELTDDDRAELVAAIGAA
jgi:hypothetical protein